MSVCRFLSVGLFLSVMAVAPAGAGPVPAQPVPAGDAAPDADAPASRLDDLLADLLSRLPDDLPDGLGKAVEGLEQLRTLHGMMGDPSDWEAPLLLPGGDILLRRKQPVPPLDAPAPDEGQPTDL